MVIKKVIRIIREGYYHLHFFFKHIKLCIDWMSFFRLFLRERVREGEGKGGGEREGRREEGPSLHIHKHLSYILDLREIRNYFIFFLSLFFNISKVSLFFFRLSV